ncbi:hypothetical protein Naga_100875g1, partial [Nannochloropsis gaditana]
MSVTAATWPESGMTSSHVNSCSTSSVNSSSSGSSGGHTTSSAGAGSDAYEKPPLLGPGSSHATACSPLSSHSTTASAPPPETSSPPSSLPSPQLRSGVPSLMSHGHRGLSPPHRGNIHHASLPSGPQDYHDARAYMPAASSCTSPSSSTSTNTSSPGSSAMAGRPPHPPGRPAPLSAGPSTAMPLPPPPGAEVMEDIYVVADSANLFSGAQMVDGKRNMDIKVNLAKTLPLIDDARPIKHRIVVASFPERSNRMWRYFEQRRYQIYVKSEETDVDDELAAQICAILTHVPEGKNTRVLVFV